MSIILSWLGDIKLSIKQALALGVATIIGGLVLALKVQGSKLHRAQLQLLEQRYHNTLSSDQEAVETARQAFQTALEAYKAAGGEV